MSVAKTAYGRGTFHCMVAVVCALVIVGCGGAASRFSSHMDRGRSYFAVGDYTHASLEFRNAMQIAPKDLSARAMAC